MDFNDTPEEASYRAQVQDWLGKNATKKKSSKDALPALSLEEALERARKWQRTKADGGYACITWPKEYGGQGGSSIQNVIYSQEESKYLAPGGFYAIGLGGNKPVNARLRFQLQRIFHFIKRWRNTFFLHSFMDEDQKVLLFSGQHHSLFSGVANLPQTLVSQ